MISSQLHFLYKFNSTYKIDFKLYAYFIYFIDSVKQLIVNTMIEWAKSEFISDQELIRRMFSLLHREYDGVGEVEIVF